MQTLLTLTMLVQHVLKALVEVFNTRHSLDQTLFLSCFHILNALREAINKSNRNIIVLRFRGLLEFWILQNWF